VDFEKYAFFTVFFSVSRISFPTSSTPSSTAVVTHHLPQPRPSESCGFLTSFLKVKSSFFREKLKTTFTLKIHWASAVVATFLPLSRERVTNKE